MYPIPGRRSVQRRSRSLWRQTAMLTPSAIRCSSCQRSGRWRSPSSPTSSTGRRHQTGSSTSRSRTQTFWRSLTTSLTTSNVTSRGRQKHSVIALEIPIKIFYRNILPLRAVDISFCLLFFVNFVALTVTALNDIFPIFTQEKNLYILNWIFDLVVNWS